MHQIYREEGREEISAIQLSSQNWGNGTSREERLEKGHSIITTRQAVVRVAVVATVPAVE